MPPLRFQPSPRPRDSWFDGRTNGRPPFNADRRTVWVGCVPPASLCVVFGWPSESCPWQFSDSDPVSDLSNYLTNIETATCATIQNDIRSAIRGFINVSNVGKYLFDFSTEIHV